MIVQERDVLVLQLNDKCTRRVLNYGPELMLVEFCFQKGGVGEPHAHENHEQVGYIVNGSFELQVGDEKRTVTKGDSYYAGKNVLHGVVALEDHSVIIDAFTPARQDFLLRRE
ncbi:MAG TPA: cupin domain-containing protein [Patescibacteria group bacterium]|nr:cupin domain-containing protein [Patescibacteria group bacterium]